MAVMMGPEGRLGDSSETSGNHQHCDCPMFYGPNRVVLMKAKGKKSQRPHRQGTLLVPRQRMIMSGFPFFFTPRENMLRRYGV
ncbi:hypothetical protein JTE90_013625 [Oedothorax gibbosus]|uniref:Uncharacterized protein n=1 Tax=Oedothorax gibbosus TaxID=931172 RepID=A0AAV6TYL1_9ARAC|nr:hypothetical protein JTE90_013625 [Oedothorax gibbosus]